jgi:hypothetical protein
MKGLEVLREHLKIRALSHLGDFTDFFSPYYKINLLLSCLAFCSGIGVHFISLYLFLYDLYKRSELVVSLTLRTLRLTEIE